VIEGVEIQPGARLVYLAALPPGRLSRFELPVLLAAGDATFVGVTSWPAFEAELRWFGLPSLVAIDFDHLEDDGLWAAALFIFAGTEVPVVVLTDHVEPVSELLGSSARVIPKSSDLNRLFAEMPGDKASWGALLRQGGTGTKG